MELTPWIVFSGLTLFIVISVFLGIVVAIHEDDNDPKKQLQKELDKMCGR